MPPIPDRMTTAEYLAWLAGKKEPARARHVTGEPNKAEENFLREWLAPREMAGEITGIWFEKLTIRLAPRCTYTPDYLVQFADPAIGLVFFEVKGHVEDDAAAKIRMARPPTQPVPIVVMRHRGPGDWVEILK